MRMIDKDEAIKILCDGCTADCDVPYTACITVQKIIDMPTIEAEPVRHGRWLSLEGWFNKSSVKCSVCGNTLNMDGVNAGRGDANFCPNCGARMDGGDNNAAD